MNLFFLFLSCIYVAVIFLMADSSVVSTISTFNLYSLLHIPLYGVLTVLLVLSIIPVQLFHFRGLNPGHPAGDRDNRIQANDLRRISLEGRFVMAGLIGLVIALADEVHQYSIPARDGSFYDVLLDLAGIALALLVMRKWLKWSEARSGSG